jgi:hypothetical protein
MRLYNQPITLKASPLNMRYVEILTVKTGSRYSEQLQGT